jgi:hypothetical protein
MQDAVKRLAELRGLDRTNLDTTQKLMDEARAEQTRYLSSVDTFQSSRRVFGVQARLLLDALSPQKVHDIVNATKHEVVGSITTVGMKAGMKTVLEELRHTLAVASNIAEETRRLVKAIYGKFREEYGFADIKPALMSFHKFEMELDRIFEEGEELRTGAFSILMEQSVIVQKLYGGIVSRTLELFHEAHAEANAWSATALSPLVRQIRDHKQAIETRLITLRKVHESAESLEQEIAALDLTLAPLQNQYLELESIRRMIRNSRGPASAEEEQPADSHTAAAAASV